MALGDTATFRINGFDEVGGNASGTFVTQTNLEVPVSVWVTGGCDGGWMICGCDGGWMICGCDGGWVICGCDGGWVTGGCDGGWVICGFDGGWVRTVLNFEPAMGTHVKLLGSYS